MARFGILRLCNISLCIYMTFLYPFTSLQASNGAISTGMQALPLCAGFDFFGYTLRHGILGSCGSSIFILSRDLHTVFPRECTTKLHSHQQWVRIFFLHSHYSLHLFYFYERWGRGNACLWVHSCVGVHAYSCMCGERRSRSGVFLTLCLETDLSLYLILNNGADHLAFSVSALCPLPLGEGSQMQAFRTSSYVGTGDRTSSLHTCASGTLRTKTSAQPCLHTLDRYLTAVRWNVNID